MRRVALLALLLAMASAPALHGADLFRVNVPRLSADDDYTYAACPSAVVHRDGSVDMAVTVGRLVSGEWGGGYEQVRLYHYTDAGVSGEIVDDNRNDGPGGLQEMCQLSLSWYGGSPDIAATTTWLPRGATDPRDRYGVIGVYERLDNGAWRLFAPVAVHSWGQVQGRTPRPWSDYWLGDPVLLHDGWGRMWLYWTEDGADSWWDGRASYRSILGALPATGDYSHGWTSVVSGPIRGKDMFDTLLDVAWRDSVMVSALALVSWDGDQSPPWTLAQSVRGYPGLLFQVTGDEPGPAGIWGRNPSFLRTERDLAVQPLVVFFESTPSGDAPPDEPPGGTAIELAIWVWSEDGARSLPAALRRTGVRMERRRAAGR